MGSEAVRACVAINPLDTLLQQSVVEQIDIPPREARFAEAPPQFAHGKLGAWLKRSLGGTDLLYLHQALALASVEQDLNVVVSTATASGKSLVFMAAAIRKILSGNSRVLVFYVQKALGSDQLGRWRRELINAGLSPDLVAEINGDIAVTDREHVLDKSRIILATPDVIHAWMMPARSAPSVARFLAKLDLLILDEAHVLEAVFGSHASLFIRRLRLARQLAVTSSARRTSGCFQLIATTATLSDPTGHLKALTGCEFVCVDENDNGAPSYGLTVLHLEGPEVGAPAERHCADLVEQVTDGLQDDAALIAFADSRQGVERIIRRVGKKSVLPYRSGYTPTDRRAIEKLLREKRLRGVVATSALELGIDLPQFSVGLTVGVPPNRKSLRQRIGRIGRARRGVFAVIAPAAAFTKLGSSLRDYITEPVEGSPLYLENSFIHFQHARCMLEEGTAEAAKQDDQELRWPPAFVDRIALAQPGAAIPKMLEETALFGRTRPHLAYSLRSMPGEQFFLRHAVTGETIGTIDHEKALREAYPGASYYHYTKEYRVENWRSFGHCNEIELRPQRSIEPTQPLLKTQVSVACDLEGIIDGRYLESDRGSLAEVHLHLTESVEGYRYGSTVLPYSELSQRDRRLRRKSRRFPTTGVLIRINEPWFAGDGDHQVASRRLIADSLLAMLASSSTVSVRDLRAAHIGVALQNRESTRRANDAVVICDNVVGGLRLTEPLITSLPLIFDRLRVGAEQVGGDALLPLDMVHRLMRWHAELRLASPTIAGTAVQTGEIEIFSPGSIVSVRVRGSFEERKILAPAMIATGAGEQLMYQYESDAGVLAFVAHDQVEPCGEDWSRSTWDPVTGSIQELT
ncbi:MAG: DEAD/DEAH box helicase [Blastomonas sp.]|uniref:DEAD/DEAH box helicase n=1 Tax=Blastomonas sp. TaxID=1909299 RepID=UPI002584DAF5|nr:DEAD/DEAH box helicase [Blastomonas sp.]MCO5792022.1 DEAD/DEAH box helicase [Blastomonas sp.]